MKTAKSDTVSFSVKGQIVIPSWLRKHFDITAGTRAVVWPEGDRIILRPMTPKRYRSLRGILKDTRAWEVFLEERRKERQL
jgi:AbrB family looped-hinge helix DNA binding protein